MLESELQDRGVLWIKEVEVVESVDDLKTSQAIGGRRFPKFEMLDAKIASILKKILMNSNFEKRVSLAEQDAQMDDRFVRGGQSAYMIYEYFRVTGAHEAVLDYSDVFSITLHGEDIPVFDTTRDQALLSTSEVRHDKILESLHEMRKNESLINSKP